MNEYQLSKSKILSGLQCPKLLYLEVHQPEMSAKSNRQQQAFSYGNQVGEIARQLHPGGRLIEYQEGLFQARKETRRLLSQQAPPPVLCEATFAHQRVLVRADIFLCGDGGHHLIEVKSSTERKDYHLWDCAIQAYVISRAGYPLSSIELAYIDNSFVYPGNNYYQG
jgi:hypothetical protein